MAGDAELDRLGEHGGERGVERGRGLRHRLAAEFDAGRPRAGREHRIVLGGGARRQQQQDDDGGEQRAHGREGNFSAAGARCKTACVEERVQPLPGRLARLAAGEHAEVPARRRLELDRRVRHEVGHVVAGGDRRDPVAAAGDRQQRDSHVGEVDRRSVSASRPSARSLVRKKRW